MSESIERQHGPEKVKGAIVEIGPGFNPRAMILALSHMARESIEEGAPYYAVDHSIYALGQVQEGAVIKTTLAEFAEDDFLDGSVASVNAFNVFGEPWTKSTRDPFLDKIFRKFYRMLTEDGHVVIGETYTPDDARHILALPFDEYGFTAEIYRGAEACTRGLATLGFADNALERLGHTLAVERYGEPFVVILAKKKNEEKVAAQKT